MTTCEIQVQYYNLKIRIRFTTAITEEYIHTLIPHSPSTYPDPFNGVFLYISKVKAKIRKEDMSPYTSTIQNLPIVRGLDIFSS